MPNLRGGNKYKSGKKGQRTQAEETLPLAKDFPNCYYGLVNKKLGTSFEVTINGKSERAIMRGKMRKKYWINIGDVVMCQFDLAEYIIIHKYKPDESKQLRIMGEIDFGKDEEGSSAITFDDEVEDSGDDELFEEMNKMKKEDEMDKKKKNKEVKELEPELKVLDPKKKGLIKELESESKETGSASGSESGSEPGSESGSDSDSDDVPENPNRIDDATDEKVEDKKLKKQFGGKTRGNKIVGERKRASARDKKDKFNTWVDGI